MTVSLNELSGFGQSLCDELRLFQSWDIVSVASYFFCLNFWKQQVCK